MLNEDDIKLHGANEVETSISKIEDGTRKNYFSCFPSEDTIRQSIPNSFIINNPMSTVGGDGYWFAKCDNMLLLAVFDCTGHGHLASMLTRMYINMIKEVIAEKGICFPHEILISVHENMEKKFHKNSGRQLATGADFGVIRINCYLNELEYAGAKMNLYEVANGTLNIIKADRMPIGEFFEHPHPYRTKVINLEKAKSSKFYLFSDGLKDLIGGPEVKKLGSTRLKELLEGSYHMTMKDQREHISKYLTQWKGYNEALDDVLLVAFGV